MDVFQYRRVSNKFYCHTCGETFTQLCDPSHYETVNCSKCKGEFVELLAKGEIMPAGLPPRPERREAPAPAASASARTQERARREQGLPIMFTMTEFDPEHSIIYEYSMMPAAGIRVESGHEAHAREEGKEESNLFESFFGMPTFPPFSFGFERNFASNFARRGNPIDFMDLARLLSMNDMGNTGKPPASKETVSRLPVFTIEEKHCKKSESGKGELESPNCAVCCCNIELGKKAQLLPCGHMYHPECLKPWLEQHNTCPVCRYELPTDDPEYERARAERARESATS